MTHAESSQDAILTKLAEMQATLDAQQAIIAQQQAAIAALQQERAAAPEPLGAAPMLHAISAEPDEVTDEAETPEAPEQRKGLTSRRSLLRGAAAATAAASVGAVALSGAQTAHAAPMADGDNLIIGQTNAGTSMTTLNVTNSALSTAFFVTTNIANTTSAAITGQSQNGATGVTGIELLNGYGVQGFTVGPTGIGVYGHTSRGIGVSGVADSGGTAIFGWAGNLGTAISGTTQAGISVSGVASDAGWGVVGQSGASYDFVANGTGIIAVNVQGTVGAPTGGYYYIGDCIRDAKGDLWLCTAGDGTSVGTWVKAAHAIAGLQGGAISYLSKPIRLFDSRPGAAANSHPGTPCAANASTKVQVAGVNYNSVSVPASLAGAIGNVTVLDGSGGGFVEIVPSGAGFTGAANLAFAPGQIVSNAFNVGLSGGALDIYVGGSNADVIIDLFAVVA